MSVEEAPPILEALPAVEDVPGADELLLELARVEGITAMAEESSPSRKRQRSEEATETREAEEVEKAADITKTSEVTEETETIKVDEVKETTETVATEEAVEPPRKRRKKEKKDKRSKREKRKKDKQDKKKEKPVRKKDELFEYDESLLEMPTEEDFNTPYGPSRKSYRWGLPKPIKKPDQVFPMQAPPPSIPTMNDNSEFGYEPVRFPGRTQSERMVTDEPKERSTRRAQPPRPLPKFLQLPLEVREYVYRELLVSPQPIMVRSGWMRIYERERAGLYTSILRVNRQIEAEAIRVLYSENTFLYRLRDPPNTGQGVVDIQRLAEDDELSEPETDFENSQEFDYDDGPKRSRSSRKKQKEIKFDINIAKFGRYFRHLIVQAEHNRYSDEVMQNMAQAISVFTAEEGNMTKATSRDGQAKAANVNTFTIRVTPMSSVSDSYTFVNFFKFNSPVIKALRRLSCKSLCIELLSKELNPTLKAAGMRYSIDMRYRRIQRQVQRTKDDMWEKDEVIQNTRAKRIRESFTAVTTLEQRIHNWCVKCASSYIGEEDTYWEDEGSWFDDELEEYNELSF